MSMSETAAVKMGRPRCFCEHAALDAAMRVFWQKSYEGAALTDRTAAMGICRPSLHASFGDKDALFRKVFAHYAEGPASYIRAALQEPTVRQVAESLLHGAVNLLGDPKNPPGCLSVQGGLACGENAELVKNALIEWRNLGEAAIQERLEQGQAEGDLAMDASPEDLARYLATVATGLAVQAANGASRAEMSRVVEMALRTFPL